MKWRWLVLGCSLVALPSGCNEPAPVDAGASPPRDATVEARPGWPNRLASTEALGTRRGRAVARTVLHLHSPLSHDACDGSGWIDGELAQPDCLERMRSALCALSVDVALLTDHAPHVEEVDFASALWIADGDEALTNASGAVVGNRMQCPDGHRVLVLAGSENALMPLGLERHPVEGNDPEALRAAYDDSGPDAVARLREAGAVVFRAHTESQPIETLREEALDGIEIYNLHANIGPDIREMWLGLEPFEYVDRLIDFANRRYMMPPDLALLAFLSENGPALDAWDTLLSEGRRVSGGGGCDAHENALAMELSDGERGDSYRRMMFWIQNHLLVDELSPDGVRDALRTGRFFVVFEVFGTPEGLDFSAVAGEQTFEMGETTPVGVTLRLQRPRLPASWPQDPPPRLSLHIVRSVDGGREEVASGDVEVLEYVVETPGAYRAEVRMVPEHAGPALGERGAPLVREVPWVYTNPIFVEE